MLEIEQLENGTIRLVGHLDASQSEKADQVLSQINGSITLDMSGLKYISSSGLSILVKTYKRLNDNGHRLQLMNLNDHIRDVFSYTRLDQFFEIE